MRVRPIHAITLFGGMLLCSNALADTFTFNLLLSLPDNAQSLTVNGGALDVKLSAWAIDSGGTLVEAEIIGTFGSAGLGIYSDGETGSPQHQLDNSGNLEFFLAEFFLAGTTTRATINGATLTVDPNPDSHVDYSGSSDIPDRDISFRVGSPVLPGDVLAGETLASLAGLFPTFANHANTASGAEITQVLNFGGGSGHSLLFGPNGLNGAGGDSIKDYFKVKTLVANTPMTQVPEPGSVLLLGTILTGVTFAIRRRRSQLVK